MTGKEFMNSVANGRSDILQEFLDILAETGSPYCLIGGLAVNAYGPLPPNVKSDQQPFLDVGVSAIWFTTPPYPVIETAQDTM